MNEDPNAVRIGKSEYRNLAVMCLLVGALITAALYGMFHLPKARAQGPIGNANFAQPFSVKTATTISYLSINNYGQSAGSVQFNGISGTECPILLEGSYNASNWWVLASSAPNSSGFGTGIFYANGFTSYYRLAFNPNSLSACGNLTVTGSYYGYSEPLPINREDFWLYVPAIASPVAATPTGANFWGLDGFQCTNEASSVAYLQLFSASSTPTLGSEFFYQVAIAGSGSFNSSALPSAVSSLPLWAGASTELSGSTAGGPLACNFEVNLTGPFYPLLPTGP